ncbi:uncharacterized protein LOC131844601 [Achroia grisella]|uniref:uncharacterized protein LOC131844601 n=1 Tax=Achroia grisella TaxID=688607 RepID=UPI0027D24B16|nr:uncharacterized protein LOC131844601 [Achroia grisella]
MIRTFVVSVVLTIVIVSRVRTAPAYHHSRGPRYTMSNAPDNHKAPYIEVRNSTYHGYGPREEARAMCSVKTHEVNATANATITRRLHGVVTSKELHSSIQRLEVIIFGQMQQLWQSLDALRLQLGGDTKAPLVDRRTVSFRYKPNFK